MATLTIKSMPDTLYDRLKESAVANHRSINSEVIVQLEEALGSPRVTQADLMARVRAVRERMMLVQDREFQPHGQHVLRLAEASGCTAYDGEFVAVARDLGVPLVTFDREVVRAFPGTAVDPTDFLAR
jgi:predicted nucleic acid-binding protein